MPASGWRTSGSGNLNGVGSAGYAWCSSSESASGLRGSNLGFSTYIDPEGSHNRTYAFPVRCVLE